MQKKSDPKAWELFDSCFKEGEEVIVIDTDDLMWWGVLTLVDLDECELHHHGWTKRLSWDDIRFMCHDGFPVRKILGADGSKTIEQFDTKDTQEVIRGALAQEFPRKEFSRVRFGDPFDVEFQSARLYHVGNSGSGFWSQFWNGLQYHSPWHREEGMEREEVIVMESKDGAKAELWDLTTIYMFER